MNYTPLARARLSLEGLSLGDSLGAFYEMASIARMAHVVTERTLPTLVWHYTDDTEMALSIYAVLRQHGTIDSDALAASFARHFDVGRGYGMGAKKLLAALKQGSDWRVLSPKLFQGGSYGNGGAMRVAPLGAFFADDLEQLVQQATLSASITHAHPEGIAGAVAIAVGAALFWRSRGAPLDRDAFFDALLPHIGVNAVAAGCRLARNLSIEATPSEAAAQLGNGSQVSAQDSVPLALYSAARFADQFEEAFWFTASAGGDVDTLCAMVGGLVALRVGISGLPTEWLARREALPAWALGN
jgi:ADP-ribosylglycohydrolase